MPKVTKLWLHFVEVMQRQLWLLFPDAVYNADHLWKLHRMVGMRSIWNTGRNSWWLIDCLIHSFICSLVG